VRHFIRLNATRLGKDLSISREAMELLQNYDWPGNIRELQNVLERLCVTCDMKIDANLAAAVLEECRLEDQASSERIDSIRRNHILEVLRQCGNNKRQAAEKLGISRTTLWRELKRHRLS
jgi:transcriptional regulator with PAS, ATPase and Fis domain